MHGIVKTFVHEMGHSFGVFHTHQPGRFIAPTDYCKCLFDDVYNKYDNYRGDFCSDTPPTYNLISFRNVAQTFMDNEEAKLENGKPTFKDKEINRQLRDYVNTGIIPKAFHKKLIELERKHVQGLVFTLNTLCARKYDLSKYIPKNRKNDIEQMLSSNIMSYGIGDWNGHGIFTTQQRSRVYCYFHNNPYLQRMVKTSSRGKPTMTVEECLKSSKTTKLISGSAAPHLKSSLWNKIPRGCSTKVRSTTQVRESYLNYGYPKKKNILKTFSPVKRI
jgi:hypothetical protein